MAGDLKCSKCNFINPHGSEYCNSCGKQLGTDCTKCGHTNSQETSHCNQCGGVTEYQVRKEEKAKKEKLKQKQVLEDERKDQAKAERQYRQWREAQQRRLAKLPKWRQWWEREKESGFPKVWEWVFIPIIYLLGALSLYILWLLLRSLFG